MKHDLSPLERTLQEILSTEPGKRLQCIFYLVMALPQGDAETCYQGLFAERCLMQHEADLLQMLGQRLNKEVYFRHAVPVLGQPLTWREGRYQDG
jgi:hypothetical protein